MFDTIKRIFVGRPLATSEQEHQRLPKTIALAVFSSDAISSTAYATEEILFVTAVGALEPGARARARSCPIAIARRAAARDRRHVVPPDDLRLPERRRLLHREPREPRRATRRSSPARRSSSTTSSRSPCRSRPASPPSSRSPQFPSLEQASRAARARAHRADQRRQPARPEGVGPHLRRPDLRLHRRCSSRSSSFGLDRELLRWSTASPGARSIPRRSTALHETGGTLGLFLHPAGLLVGRRRADRRRGDLRRRAGVPPARVEERGDHARVDGDDPRLAVLRRLGPRPPPAPVPERRRDGALADGPSGVRRRRRLLRPAVRHRRDPDPGRQHRLRRLPAAVVDHRQRRLPPAPARQPRRPARVLERHRRPRRRWRAC